MKRYFWIIICIIWTIYVSYGVYSNMWHVNDWDDVYTSTNGDAYDSQKNIVYVTDNIDESGFVLAIGVDNKVTAIFDANGYAKGTFCDELFLEDDRLYALIHGNTEQNNFPIKAYTILELNPDTLQVVAHSNWFTPYDKCKSLNFSKDDSYFYITGISQDDMQAEVYVVSVDNMNPVADSDDNNIRNVSTIRYSSMVEPSEGYHFVHAQFENGNLTTMENGNGVLSDDIYNSLVRERFENKKFTVEQLILINKADVILGLFIALAGILFILSMYFFVKRRNRVAYMIVIWEVMLVIVLGYVSMSLLNWSRLTDWDDLINFASFTLQDVRTDLNELESQFENTSDFYRTEEYRDVSDKLRKVVDRYANGEVFENALSITAKHDDYHIIAAAKGLDNCDLEVVYGPSAVTLVNEVHKTGERYSSSVTIDGVTYHLVCVGNEDEMKPTSMLLAVVKKNATDVTDAARVLMVVLVCLFIFAVASIIGARVLIKQAKDLKVLGATMMDVSQGGIGIAKPKTLGEDMSDMWSGLLDIDRNFKNLNYIKYRTFESYYKFAPKSIERLLDKTSITEVANGDAVRKKGTVVMMSTDTNNMLIGLAKTKNVSGPIVLGSKAGAVLEAISRHQEENRMYKISCTSDFSELQLLMPESTVDCTKIGTELTTLYRGEGYGACLFMHYTDYLYGVSIAGEEAAQFLLSSDIIRIRQNVNLLNELRLAQVITNTVYERELEKPNSRYIGYWELGTEERIDLYEVLDAYDDDTRHRREETRELFAEGLELFYESQFYLARNNFAKILKVDQTDTVARWYLFTSEKYLDGTSEKTNFSLSE